MRAPSRSIEASISLSAIEVGDRLRKPDMETIGELAEDMGERGLLQRIGVRQQVDAGYDLIWGRHRYEAAAKLGWPAIGAVVYPPGTPDDMLLVLEITENLRRHDLTFEEKAAHTTLLLATLKEAEPQSLDGPEFAKPTTGRGHKGEIQKVAEVAGVDQSTVRNRLAAAGVDPVKDTPAVLREKAAEVRSGSRPMATRPRPKVEATSKVKSGASLLEAMGRMVAFTPAAAVRWLEANPGERAKIKDMVPTVNAIMSDLSDVFWPSAEAEPGHADVAGDAALEREPEKLSPTRQWERDHPDDKRCPRDPVAAKSWRIKRGLQEARGMHGPAPEPEPAGEVGLQAAIKAAVDGGFSVTAIAKAAGLGRSVVYNAMSGRKAVTSKTATAILAAIRDRGASS